MHCFRAIRQKFSLFNACLCFLLCATLTTAYAEELSRQRIITLAPHATELLYSLGVGDRIIATVEYSDFPAAALAIPRLGRSDEVSLEAVLALAPDLVIVWDGGNSPELIRTLEAMGLNVYRSDTQGLASVPNTLKELGVLTGTEIKAAQLITKFNQRIQSLTVDPDPERVPAKVFFQLWESPLMTSNHSLPISEIIQRCGGQNIFADFSEEVPQTSVENVLILNPDVIIAPAQGLSAHWQDRWMAWPEMTAAKYQQLFTVNADIISRPTLRLADGMEVVCRLLGNNIKVSSTTGF